MTPDFPVAWAPNLVDAIDRHPLIVPPTTPLIDAIALISQVHGQVCSLKDVLALPGCPIKQVRASCVLVMQGQELLGILTERDVVRLTAEAINFVEVTVADVMVCPLITLPQNLAQDIFAALFLFRRYRIRHLPIMDEHNQLVGVISHESIRQILRPANMLQLCRVSDVMTTQVVQAPVTATVLQLAQLMAEHRVSCIVITQWDARGMKQPIGIITERDILQLQALQIDLDQAQAHMVMSTPLFLLSPEDSLWAAHEEMQKRRVGRLVVSWNWGQGLGIVTQTSLLKVFDPMELYGVIENLQQTIQQLEAKQSTANPSPLLNPLPDPLNFPSALLKQARSSPERNTVGGRYALLVLLDSAYQKVNQMIATSDLSVEQQRSGLQSVLEALEQLNREMRS